MDVEKTIEFIVAQQAQFSSDLIELRKHTAINQSHFAALEKHLMDFEGLMAKWVDRIEAGNQTRDEKARERDQKIADLATKVDALTEDVHALVRVVDGMIRGGNGDQRE